MKNKSQFTFILFIFFLLEIFPNCAPPQNTSIDVKKTDSILPKQKVNKYVFLQFMRKFEHFKFPSKIKDNFSNEDIKNWMDTVSSLDLVGCQIENFFELLDNFESLGNIKKVQLVFYDIDSTPNGRSFESYLLKVINNKNIRDLSIIDVGYINMLLPNTTNLNLLEISGNYSSKIYLSSGSTINDLKIYGNSFTTISLLGNSKLNNLTLCKNDSVWIKLDSNSHINKLLFNSCFLKSDIVNYGIIDEIAFTSNKILDNFKKIKIGNVNKLSFYNVFLSDSIQKFIGSIDGLSDLSIQDCNIDINNLLPLTNLKKINLKNSKVSNPQSLLLFKNLAYLNIQGTCLETNNNIVSFTESINKKK